MGKVIEDIALKTFGYVPTGSVGFSTIQDNFNDIQTKINDMLADMERREERTSTIIRSVLVEDSSIHTLMDARDHRNCKIKAAWVIAADNLKMEQEIRLMVKTKDIVEKRKIAATEKAGKAQAMVVNPHYIINRFEDVDIIPSSNRKCIVTAIVEEVE